MTPAGRSERLARERSSEKHCWLVAEREVWFHRKGRLRKVFLPHQQRHEFDRGFVVLEK